MKKSIIDLYRENRKPVECLHLVGGARSTHYPSASTALWQARHTVKAEKVNHRFQAYEQAGLAKVELEPETDWIEWEELEGDSFNPDANPEIDPRVLKQEQEEYRAKVERDGLWCVCAYIRNGEDWELIESVGMIDSCDDDMAGYKSDLQFTAVNVIDAMHKEAQEERADVREQFHTLVNELRSVALPDNLCGLIRSELVKLRNQHRELTGVICKTQPLN